MGEVKLTMAKADEEEFDRIMKFVNLMDAFFNGHSFFSSEDDWKNWPDDDEDKQKLLEIEHELKEDGEGLDWDGMVDNRLVLFEFIKQAWHKANYCGSFDRIIMDAKVLIDNVCDPSLDYLDFKPEIKEAIDEYEKNHEVNLNK